MHMIQTIWAGSERRACPMRLTRGGLLAKKGEPSRRSKPDGFRIAAD